MFLFQLKYDGNTHYDVLKKYFFFCGIQSSLDSCWWGKESGARKQKIPEDKKNIERKETKLMLNKKSKDHKHTIR